MGVLRTMTPADLDELLVVQREGAVAGLGHIYPQDTHPFPTDVIRARWERELDDPAVRAWVVEEDGRVSGFAATRGAELFHFGTGLWTWGSGLAGRAHDEVVEAIRADGHEVAWLKVLVDNERAVRLYRRKGWQPTGEVVPGEYPPFPLFERYVLPLR